MTTTLALLVDLAAIVLLIAGISMFRAPQRARLGNLVAALALTVAVVLVLRRHNVTGLPLVLTGVAAGTILGWIVAVRVTMIQIPAMIAFQHGAGGVAAFLIAFVELTRSAGALTPVTRFSGILGLAIGAATFSASMVASGKLAAKLRSAPVSLRFHNGWLWLCAAFIVGAGIALLLEPASGAPAYAAGIIIVAAAAGILFSIRVGGADMPVLISFLNATAGLAAAFCGVTLENRLLIAFGAVVAASGSVLTLVMCRAMNRDLLKVFAGFTPAAAPAGAAPEHHEPKSPGVPPEDPFLAAVDALKEAESVIIVPGYGMALAKAQFKVVELAGLLERQGKQVRFAIHPVAGRMPGHMHVLLAEADLDYEQIFDMADINGDFASTDAVLVVGACDVVNPAAMTVEGCPISGMPILLAHEAKRVIVCNLDSRPGYSGVENPLYESEKAVLLWGDASDSVSQLVTRVGGEA